MPYDPLKELKDALRERREAQQKEARAVEKNLPDPFAPDPKFQPWDESARGQKPDPLGHVPMYGENENHQEFFEHIAHPDAEAIQQLASETGNPELVHQALDDEGEAAAQEFVDAHPDYVRTE